MNSSLGRRSLCAALCLACLTVLWLAVPPQPVHAHPCDDLYTRQQDRETCWWNYWNGRPPQPSTARPGHHRPVREYTTKPHRLHPGDPRIAPRDRKVPYTPVRQRPVRQYTTKPHRLQPCDPRIAPRDRWVSEAYCRPWRQPPKPTTQGH